MNISINQFKLALLACISMGLISCGGGGSSSTSSTTAPTISTMSGTAATGAPITNAAVTIFDSKGNAVCNTTTDANGAYTCAGIDTTNNPGPYIVKVVGGVGDSVDTLYAVAASAGTANISHISNAMAASLAKGNPASLEAGTSSTTADVSKVESGFQAALSSLYASFNFTGSVVTGAFNSTMDGILDNTHANALGDGTTELGSSQGFAEDGLMGDSGVTTGSSALMVSTAAGNTPGASDSGKVPAITNKVTAASLETLRAQLQACFSHPAAERVTLGSAVGSNGAPVWTNLHKDCQGLDDGQFKHESFYWIDGLSTNSLTSPSYCTSSNSAYCLGQFGAMLTNSVYDNLQFLKPRNMRPVGTDLWHVQFPVMYCDDASKAGVTCGPNGTRGQFGDVIGSYSYAVVKLDKTSGNFYMHGDQRDIQSYILPTAQLVQKGSSNTYRVESNFNMYIRPYSIRSLKPNNNLFNQNTVWPVYTVVTPLTANGMLPAGGVTLANKINVSTLTSGTHGSNTPNSGTRLAANSNISSLPSSGVSGNSLFFNVCDGYMNFENKAIAPTSSNLFSYTAAANQAAPCSGQLRMAYGEYTRDSKGVLQQAAAGLYPPASYPSGMINPSQINNYNADGTLKTTPSAWPTTFTAKKGEPYLFTVYLSNGNTLKYVNRLPASLLTVDQAAKVTYPLFTSDTVTNFASFNGAGPSNNSLPVAWSGINNGYVFQSALMWDRAEGSTNNGVKVGATSNSISCSSYVSGLSVASFAPGSTNMTDPLNCKDTANWISGANGNNVDSGILQLKARTPQSLFISTQVRQY